MMITLYFYSIKNYKERSKKKFKMSLNNICTIKIIFLLINEKRKRVVKWYIVFQISENIETEV